MTFLDYDLDKLVSEDNVLRKISAMICFSRLCENNFTSLSSRLGCSGYGVTMGLKCLFLQFFYDLSDRELEERLRHDMSFR